MRGVLGTRTVEAIISGQQLMAAEVLEGARKDLEAMGLALLSFSFKEITDEQGFIAALAEPRIAQVKRDAVVARAEAEKDSIIKQALLKQEGDVIKLKSEAEMMQATASFEIQRAGQQAEVNEQRARSDVAYDLERLRVSQQLKEQEAELKLLEKRKAIEIQEQEVVRRERELDASVRRPAEAHSFQARLEAELEAYRKELEGKGQAALIAAKGRAEAEAIKTKGQAEAEAMAARADSYRHYNQAALAEMFVKILPEMARAVSEPLARVEKIVMVGGGENIGIASLTGQIASAVAQVPSVIESLTGVKLGHWVESFIEKKGERTPVELNEGPSPIAHQ
jgi:flotillin